MGGKVNSRDWCLVLRRGRLL